MTGQYKSCLGMKINYLAHIRAIVARMSRDNQRELLMDECSTDWVDMI